MRTAGPWNHHWISSLAYSQTSAIGAIVTTSATARSTAPRTSSTSRIASLREGAHETRFVCTSIPWTSSSAYDSHLIQHCHSSSINYFKRAYVPSQKVYRRLIKIREGPKRLDPMCIVKFDSTSYHGVDA